MSYPTQTVSQLKELLKARGLATNGLKNDLVARLEQSDNETGAENGEVTKPLETDAAPVTTEDSNDTLEAAAETKAEEEEAKPETTEETETPKPKVKVLTPEERKAHALELLQKKLNRAKKFGSEEDAENVKRDIARVERFGVEPGTSLAKELGLVSKEGLSTGKSGDHVHRKHRHRR